MVWPCFKHSILKKNFLSKPPPAIFTPPTYIFFRLTFLIFLSQAIHLMQLNLGISPTMLHATVTTTLCKTRPYLLCFLFPNSTVNKKYRFEVTRMTWPSAPFSITTPHLALIFTKNGHLQVSANQNVLPALQAGKSFCSLEVLFFKTEAVSSHTDTLFSK